MKILIVGGTGMIGGHAALKLVAEGHEVVLGARKPAAAGTPMEHMPVLLGDYSRGDFTPKELEGFDAVVFAAGNDIRHLQKGADADEFWRVMQIEGVPAFARRAKQAGVRRLVQLGSYYHQVMPQLAERDAYVRARKLADEGARALTGPDFNVSTLNPPSIVGFIPGIAAKRYETLVAWARGERPDLSDFAPAGGTNYMSVRSLSEAISGALRKAEPGKAYLIGDQNLTFRDFFQMIFDAAGAGRRLEERDAEHPVLPDAFIVPGRGNVLAYEPDPAETQLLGYTRNDVMRAVREIVALVPERGK
jgi:nucleoside-diphosphate-sugar epimerase